MSEKSCRMRSSYGSSAGFPEVSAPTRRSRSAPAEKLPSAPVITPTRSSGSASSRSQASQRRQRTSALKALRLSGRFSVMVRTWPSRSVSTAGSDMRCGLAGGDGSAELGDDVLAEQLDRLHHLVVRDLVGVDE